MMIKSLVLWLYGNQLGNNATLLNALYANSHTTARTREHLSRLYFDNAIGAISGNDEMELVRNARRELPVSELDSMGDQQLESRFLPTIMSEEVRNNFVFIITDQTITQYWLIADFAVVRKWFFLHGACLPGECGSR